MLQQISQTLIRTLNDATNRLSQVMALFQKPTQNKLSSQNNIQNNIQANFYDKLVLYSKNLYPFKYQYKSIFALTQVTLGKYECFYWSCPNIHYPISIDYNRFVYQKTLANLLMVPPQSRYAYFYVKTNIVKSLILYEDNDTLKLKLQIDSLQNDIGCYDNERIELEKLLADFNHRHMMELGEIIAQILALKKQLAKHNDDEIAYEQTHEFEQQYNEQRQQETQKIRYALGDEDKKRLKKLYKKASSFCHPDRVCDEQKDQAEQLFHELRQAYEQNDLASVKQLLGELEKGIFRPRNTHISQKDQLMTLKTQMTNKLQRIIHAINDIKKSPSYQQISQIDDWDGYFAEQKQLLQQEQQRLSQKLCEYLAFDKNHPPSSQSTAKTST